MPLQLNDYVNVKGQVDNEPEVFSFITIETFFLGISQFFSVSIKN